MGGLAGLTGGHTARAFSEDIAAAREMGMNAHIAKPIDMKTVMETMSKVLL